MKTTKIILAMFLSATMTLIASGCEKDSTPTLPPEYSSTIESLYSDVSTSEPTETEASESKKDETEAPKTDVSAEAYSINIDISCEENLMFSRYDICVYVDNTKLGILEHGTQKKFSASLTEGVHTIRFTEEGNESVDGSVDIVVGGNNTYKLEIACKNDQVKVESSTSVSPETSKPETEAPETEAPETEAPAEAYSIGIDVSCEENLMFSRYDVCVYADNTKLGVVEHGTHNIFSASLTKGTHTIKFTEEGNESVDGSVNIVVDGNNTFKFEIACKNDQVEVESNASTSPDTSKTETDKPNTDNNGNDGGNILDDIFGDSQTTGQKNALRTAKNYLSVMSFSKKGLIEQLEYEGYSTEDATYAAENCGANWKEQSLNHAKSYLNTMAFSYSGLINQLDYEGYSAEEATYGADNCGADWNEQAAKKAKSYLDVMAFSRDGLIDQLMYEGFTYDQAIYGVTAVGY